MVVLVEGPGRVLVLPLSRMGVGGVEVGSLGLQPIVSPEEASHLLLELSAPLTGTAVDQFRLRGASCPVLSKVSNPQLRLGDYYVT